MSVVEHVLTMYFLLLICSYASILLLSSHFVLILVRAAAVVVVVVVVVSGDLSCGFSFDSVRLKYSIFMDINLSQKSGENVLYNSFCMKAM